MISKKNIKYVRSLGLKKNRSADKVFVAEGTKLVADLANYFSPRYIAATNRWIADNPVLLENAGRCGCVVDEVTDDELCKISFHETPQEVLVVFSQPEYKADMAEVAAEELCLALDGVQNPGNLGTIIRIADWFGIQHIFCSYTCADIYNPKTVQATMGAMARVKIHYCDLVRCFETLPADTSVYGTFLDGVNMYTQDLVSRGVIIMGNEGRGISPEVERFVTSRIFIPNYPPQRETSESLNVAVATSIVCAEFRRRTFD